MRSEHTPINFETRRPQNVAGFALQKTLQMQ